MTSGQDVLERVRELLSRLAGDRVEPLPPDPAPGARGRPTRLIVAGRSPLMDYYRPFEQAHRLDPRMRLWRDTAAVLVVIALVLVAWDWLPQGSQGVLGETSAPSQPVSPGATAPDAPGGAPSASLEPGVSAGPSVPGTTPGTTPGPGPTPRATPRTTSPAPGTPGPSPAPSASAKPTAPPTPTEPPVTPAPTPAPTEPPPTPAPVNASFTVSCSTGSFEVTFDASATTGATAWAWDFGDGATGSGEVVTHAYPLLATPPVKTYDVFLTATGPGGVDVRNASITVPCPQF